MGAHLAIRDEALGRFRLSKDEQLALRRCLSVVESFRAVRRIMPLQHAYTFLLVAWDEGHSVSEYAKRAGVTQAVMTRILFSLGSSGQGRAPGYGLVQPAIDLEDPRRTQSFLTAKGKVLMREIVRLVHSGRTKQSRDLILTREPARDIARDQWLSRLVAAGGKLDTKEIKLAVQLIEALVRHRQSSGGL
jgi:DNA-binding MarR family transcriptional regulator